jgi:hypothetical protein
MRGVDEARRTEETPRAPAGLLEAALHMLVNGITPNMRRQPEISVSVERIRQLRPALVSAVIVWRHTIASSVPFNAAKRPDLRRQRKTACQLTHFAVHALERIGIGAFLERFGD